MKLANGRLYQNVATASKYGVKYLRKRLNNRRMQYLVYQYILGIESCSKRGVMLGIGLALENITQYLLREI